MGVKQPRPTLIDPSMPSSLLSAQSSSQHATLQSKRKFLKNSLRSSLGIAATVGFGSTVASSELWAAMSSAEHHRSLNLHNAHTGDKYQGTYWKDGRYDEEQILQISHLFRDHRENETMLIDTAVMDILWGVRQQVDPGMHFSIISGYRTPKTNEMLRKKSNKVAKFSLHMIGKAVDIRGTESKISRLRDAALNLEAGGVGFYPGAGFIHFDSGDVRNW